MAQSDKFINSQGLTDYTESLKPEIQTLITKQLKEQGDIVRASDFLEGKITEVTGYDNT